MKRLAFMAATAAAAVAPPLPKPEMALELVDLGKESPVRLELASLPDIACGGPYGQVIVDLT